MDSKYFEITYQVLLTASAGCLVTLLTNQLRSLKRHKNAMESIVKKLDDIETKVDEQSMRSSRYRIIRFDDELTMGFKHSIDHFNQIIEDIDVYQTYCDTHPHFVNHKGKNAMKRILKAYDDRKEKEKNDKKH